MSEDPLVCREIEFEDIPVRVTEPGHYLVLGPGPLDQIRRLRGELAFVLGAASPSTPEEEAALLQHLVDFHRRREVEAQDPPGMTAALEGGDA